MHFQFFDLTLRIRTYPYEFGYSRETSLDFCPLRCNLLCIIDKSLTTRNLFVFAISRPTNLVHTSAITPPAFLRTLRQWCRNRRAIYQSMDATSYAFQIGAEGRHGVQVVGGNSGHDPCHSFWIRCDGLSGAFREQTQSPLLPVCGWGEFYHFQLRASQIRNLEKFQFTSMSFVAIIP